MLNEYRLFFYGQNNKLGEKLQKTNDILILKFASFI